MSAANSHAKSSSHAKKISVVFINPGMQNSDNPTGGFWRRVSVVMEKAASDLNIDLEVLYAKRNHFLMNRIAEHVLNRKKLPDYMMVVNEKLAAGRIIQLADSKGVKTFSLLVGFYGKQGREMGQPRVKYKNWIGGLIPDNKRAGYVLAKSLIELAKSKGYSEKNIKFLPIGGDFATKANLDRIRGLDEAKNEYSGITFFPERHCLWRRDEAFEVTSKFLNRDPSINVIWAANDPMALGALEAAQRKGLAPGKDIFVGGINWDTPALEAINKGTLDLSVGGHFMAGGLGLAMIFDYHHGYDFAGPDGPVVTEKFFAIADKKNVKDLIKQSNSNNWGSIDFRKFSKVYNKSLKNYNYPIN